LARQIVLEGKTVEISIALILAAVIGIVHFLGEELEGLMSGYREEVVSFSSGASITYIFVQLMPEFHRIAAEASETIFIFPLLGFSSIHVVEKYLAKSSIEGEQMKRDYAEIHSAFIFLYSGAIGYLIASLIAENAVSGLLFFLPIIMHVAVSSFSVTELHEKFSRKTSVKYTVSLAPILGVLSHRTGLLTKGQFNPVFGTVIGMFFYIVIRDSIPDGDKGKPVEYATGMLIYLVVILSANTL
jgi:uncharacterized membrane protein YiaA